MRRLGNITAFIQHTASVITITQTLGIEGEGDRLYLQNLHVDVNILFSHSLVENGHQDHLHISLILFNIFYVNILL